MWTGQAYNLKPFKIFRSSCGRGGGSEGDKGGWKVSSLEDDKQKKSFKT